MNSRTATSRTNELEPDFASGLRRLCAFLIDFLPLFALFSVMSLGHVSVIFIPAIWFSDLNIEAIIALAVTAPVMAVMEVSFGQTPGKMLLGIRVVKTDASPMDLRSALIRNFVRIYEFLFVVMFWWVLVLYDAIVRRPLPGWASGAYRMFWSSSSQRWGDELAGTYVIRGQWKPVLIGRKSPASLSTCGPDAAVRKSHAGIRLSDHRHRR